MRELMYLFFEFPI